MIEAMAERVGSVEIVIKGGRPWGFTLQGGAENKTSLTVAQIEPNGKAERQGSLRVGDQVIKINDVHCLSLTDALQLIDCAFRTLTLLVWRNSTEAPTPPKNAKDFESVLSVSPGFIPAIRRNQYTSRRDHPRGTSQYIPGDDFSRSCESLRYIPDVGESDEERSHLICNGYINSHSLLSLPSDFNYVNDFTNASSNSLEVDEKNANMVSRRFDKKQSIYKVLENKSGLDFAPLLNRQPVGDRREFFESMTSDSGYHDDIALTLKDKSSIIGSPGDTTAIKYGRVAYPPSIPCRNSSLRYSQSSAHEKYPSWPETSPRIANAGSETAVPNQRSSSWAEHMGTPKQSAASYSRLQNMYHISTQHLHPVHEKTAKGAVVKNTQVNDVSGTQQGKRLTEAERLSAEAIARFFKGSYFEVPSSRDSREYKTHSPPERDPPAPSFPYLSDDEVYNKNYENMLRHYSKSPALYGKWVKENNLSLSSATPLLDRLRMEKDTVSKSWPLFEESVIPRDAFTRIEDSPSDRKLNNDARALEQSLASTCSSQETLKMRSSYSDMEEPFWCTYYRNLENANEMQVAKSPLSSKSTSGADISACSETTSIETESFDGNKSSRWDISNLLCSSRSNSCWSLTDSKKKSAKERSQNPNDQNNQKNTMRGFSTSFPGFSSGARVKSPPNATSCVETTISITPRSRSLSYSTDTLDSDASHTLVNSRRKQRHDQNNEKSRKSYGMTEPELKAIQKQAVLSFYHRQRGLSLTPACSSQETSPLPPPETPPPVPPSTVRNINPPSPVFLPCIDTNDQSSDFADIDSEDFKGRASDHRRPTNSIWRGCGRKAQLKKIYDDSDTAVVKVITADGITLAESIRPIRSPKQFLKEDEKFQQTGENLNDLVEVPVVSNRADVYSSASSDLPLPSPPPLIEGDPTMSNDEPLPPPPPSALPPIVDHQADEALYVNLEELKMKNSPSQLVNSSTQTTVLRPENPAKTQAEIDCERLSKDFASHIDDPTLRNILVPTTHHRTMSDYMKGLLNLELEKGGKPSPRFLQPRNMSDICMDGKEEKMQKNEVTLPLTSAYFTTSEPKAKLLTRYSQNFDKKNWLTETELKEKKEELATSISKKLEILKIEQIALKEEVRQNDELGNKLTSKVVKVAKPNEIEKYRLHVEELEKIINLLLSLSGRLARAQNALLILPKEVKVEEKCILEAKRDKLSQQHEEARNLKENIDKRSYQVSLFLHNYLTLNEYADYDHFIKMKSKLLMDAREIDEKIKLGEEQLFALQSSMDMDAWKSTTVDMYMNNHHKILNT